MALTDQELLILDNFMYMDGSVSSGKEYGTLGALADDYLADPNLWVMDEWSQETIDQYTDILTQIKDNENLRNLGMGEATPMETDNMIRARCFVEYDAEGNVAGHVVATRGTGGTWEAWKDNCEGVYEAETPCQGLMLDFVETLPYNDITMTGHSKGGNMAMYVTAMAGDQVVRCVSFDGQGFGEAFYDNISKEDLADASAKTTSVYTHNDFVNPLLTSFAGTEICVSNEYGGLEGAHGFYPLLKSNEAALNENGGYFTEEMNVDQDLWLEWADLGLDTFLRFFPEDERNLIADLAGSALGEVMGKNSKEDTLGNNLWGDITNYGDAKLNKLNSIWEGMKSGAEYVVDTGVDMISGVGGNLWELLSDGKDDIVQLGQNAGKNLMETGSEFKDNFLGLFDGEGNALGEVWNMLVDVGGGLGETVIDGGKDVLNFGSNLLGNAWDTAKDFGTDVVEVLGDGVEFVEDGIEFIKDEAIEFASDVKDTAIDIYETGEATLEFIVDGAKDAVNYLDNLIEMPWER